MVRLKVEYASVVWNSVKSTEARKMECIQRKFAALCQNRFLMLLIKECFKKFEASYFILQKTFLDALFLSSVYSGIKCCPSLGRYRY
jgi:hypothetical protein